MARPRSAIAVNAATRSPVAFARALSAYSRAMRRCEVEILTRGDEAAVHDFRVALRALRSLFKAAGKHFDDAPRANFRAEFAWLTQRTAPVRDLDVLRAALSAYLAEVPAAAVRLEQSFRPVLDAARAGYFADLLAALRSPRYHALLRNWQTSLAALRRDTRPAPTIGEQITRALRRRRRILLDYRRRQLKDAETLHAFRKDCKRLRYLTEAFHGLFEPESLRDAIDTYKQMQTLCGECWDAEVHAYLLKSLAPRIRPPLAAVDFRALMDVLTVVRATRSTLVMNAFKDFQRSLKLLKVRLKPRTSR